MQTRTHKKNSTEDFSQRKVSFFSLVTAFGTTCIISTKDIKMDSEVISGWRVSPPLGNYRHLSTKYIQSHNFVTILKKKIDQIKDSGHYDI